MVSVSAFRAFLVGSCLVAEDPSGLFYSEVVVEVLEVVVAESLLSMSFSIMSVLLFIRKLYFYRAQVVIMNFCVSFMFSIKG